jgi:hypothetical protein
LGAQRPFTEIALGAIMGPLLLVLVSVLYRASTNQPLLPLMFASAKTMLQLSLLFAAAGGLGGLTYARIVGRRA